MSKYLFIFFQYTLPQQWLSRFAGWMANSRCRKLKNYLISWFIRRYQVDLSLAASARLEDYPNFNAFFTRALKSEARPIAADTKLIVSPVDGCISQIGRIEKTSLLQAKGAYFTVAALLGKAEDKDFYNGYFATFYLSPKDYHRVHLPFAGKLQQTTYIPGKLFSVNPLAAENIPNLFARNERLVCLFETDLGPMAVIFIGAMLVGKIETVWGLVERANKIITRTYSSQDSIHLEKGAELGRFHMGSSVIILFGKDKLAWLPGLQENTPVVMGQAIAGLSN